MYVSINDQTKDEEADVNYILQRGKGNGEIISSSENENSLPARYFRKENRRFKHNLKFLEKKKSDTRFLANAYQQIPESLSDNQQIELDILKKKKNVEPTGTVIACCLGTDFKFSSFVRDFKTPNVNSYFIKIKKAFNEVLFCSAFEQKKTFFLFRFGCVVLWDFDIKEKEFLFMSLKGYLNEPYTENNNEIDNMLYILNVPNGHNEEKGKDSTDLPFKVKNDVIYLSTKDIFEKLSYSYAFAQSVKLSYFEEVVDDTIDKTKSIPECLAKNGKIQLKKNDISKKIGELFVNRFYINMNTDILDTPEIFWDHDDFTDTYEYFRKYLDISKRVEILNHRLDIIKDLYDMLQNEMTIQHGYKLEWIVIYLICVEVIIDIVWTIIIKGVFKWV